MKSNSNGPGGGFLRGIFLSLGLEAFERAVGILEGTEVQWNLVHTHFSTSSSHFVGKKRLQGVLFGHELDTILSKRMIHIESARAPFTSSAVAFQALTAIARAEAMGLLPVDERIEMLDVSALRKVIRHIRRAGIARTIPLGWEDNLTNGKRGLERMLERLNTALEESPVPEFEWNRLTEVLGLELLARLLGISASSVRRYKAAARTTPDEVADRLHFLSLVVGDLSGAYNEIGIRQWFGRKRAQLSGRTPAELLKGRWKREQPAAQQVRDLAHALVASPAT